MIQRVDSLGALGQETLSTLRTAHETLIALDDLLTAGAWYRNYDEYSDPFRQTMDRIASFMSKSSELTYLLGVRCQVYALDLAKPDRSEGVSHSESIRRIADGVRSQFAYELEKLGSHPYEPFEISHHGMTALKAWNNFKVARDEKNGPPIHAEIEKLKTLIGDERRRVEDLLIEVHPEMACREALLLVDSMTALVARPAPEYEFSGGLDEANADQTYVLVKDIDCFYGNFLNLQNLLLMPNVASQLERLHAPSRCGTSCCDRAFCSYAEATWEIARRVWFDLVGIGDREIDWYGFTNEDKANWADPDVPEFPIGAVLPTFADGLTPPIEMRDLEALARFEEGFFSAWPEIYEQSMLFGWEPFHLSLIELKGGLRRELELLINPPAPSVKPVAASRDSAPARTVGRPANPRQRRKSEKATELTSKQLDAVHAVANANENFTLAGKQLGMSRQAVKQHYDAAMKKLGASAIKHKTVQHPLTSRGSHDVAERTDTR